MKILVAILMMCWAAAAQTNELRIAGVPYHPFRKVGDRYYDLRPAYLWLQSWERGQKPKYFRPMPEWTGCQSSIDGGGAFTVWRVTKAGLIVSRDNRNGLSEDMFFLKNYPHQKKVAEREEIKFLALKTGVTNQDGSTYHVYDYGTPYDPSALSQKSASTNSPSKQTK